TRLHFHPLAMAWRTFECLLRPVLSGGGERNEQKCQHDVFHGHDPIAIVAAMTSGERMEAAMSPADGNLPDRIPVMCPLALGHDFLTRRADEGRYSTRVVHARLHVCAGARRLPRGGRDHRSGSAVAR